MEGQAPHHVMNAEHALHHGDSVRHEVVICEMKCLTMSFIVSRGFAPSSKVPMAWAKFCVTFAIEVLPGV